MSQYFRIVHPEEVIKKYDFWHDKTSLPPTKNMSHYVVSSYRIGHKLKEYIDAGDTNTISFNLWRECEFGDAGFRLPGNPIYSKELPLP